MKRILAITLTIIMVLAVLTGCNASQNPSGKEGEQNPSGKRLPITLTLAETLPSCVAFEYKDKKPYCFYAYDTEGHLYRVLWNNFTGLNEKDVVVIDHNDEIKKLDYANPPGGWSPKYEVTAISVKKENAADDHLVSHIQITSGTNTIFPFGSLLWSKTDNGDGTFTEVNAAMLDTHEIVSLYTDVIPKLVLNESVSYSVQVNGQVEKVSLLTFNEDSYTKSETTFDALSNLEDGTYYVAFNVLLSGNCDPDAPQNSSRYEDIFCLVVGTQTGDSHVDRGDEFNDHVPYDAMLNLEVIDGKFRFQRIATTPCIVYSNTLIDEMSKGTMYDDRHDILTTIFRIMDGKDAIMDTSECDFSHYIYMFDNEREDIPWHYRFSICNCGAVMITNNDELICTIRLNEEERRSIFPADLIVDTEPSDTNYPVGEVQLHPLYKKYPEYWDVDGMKGVEVYVWQTEDGSYRCGALMGTNRLKTDEEIQALFDNGATIEEMRTILELSEIAKERVNIIHISNPLSSNWYEIDMNDEELKKVETLFWKD